jgi:hypothetical protein
MFKTVNKVRNQFGIELKKIKISINMNLGKINLITPPDKLYNSNVSYLLVKPSTKLKLQFQQKLSKLNEDINVYIFDDDEQDIDWLLSVSQTTDFVIVDIDNCDKKTLLFVALILTQPNSYYYTLNDDVPWNLISRNRIYDLDWIQEVLDNDEETDE